MKKSIYLIFLIMLFSLLLAQTATPPAGSGTESDPYQIATLDNLYWIADSAYRDGYYIQTADINAAETATWFPTDTGGFYGWKPIGYFKGSYDGQNHIIDSLYICRDTLAIGFFKNIYDHSIINNLGLTNVRITGGDWVGGLVGTCGTQTIINYCYCTGSVSGNRYVGGLTGTNLLSKISYCYTDVTVRGKRGRVGGISGMNSLSSYINNCYSNGSVSSEEGRCGGIVGWNSDSTISFCYSTCSVSGTEDIGGLVGYKSYSSSINNSFWDMQTSGLDSSAGGSGRTTAEMKTQSTYTDSGWNFTDVWMIDPAYNNGYPVLRWHPGVGVKEEILPESAMLNQNYPNPFNPVTAISWQLPADSDVKLEIYDITGKKITTLINDYQSAGYHTINWDASALSSGIYFYRLKTRDFVETKKMVLMK